MDDSKDEDPDNTMSSSLSSLLASYSRGISGAGVSVIIGVEVDGKGHTPDILDMREVSAVEKIQCSH